MDERNGDGEILEDIERRALLAMSEEEDEGDDEVDIIRTLSGDEVAEPATDLTLAGYIEKHNRVPAFEGSDGQPYTVDVAFDETGEADRPIAAFLVFIRWAETGAGIMDHTESGDVAFGATEEEARIAIGELSLYEVKAELDAAIERRRSNLEE